MGRKRTLRTASIEGFTLTEGIHPAGSSLPWHTHAGPTICFVLHGAFTEISAGETLDCRPAMLKVTPAEERHWNRFDRGDAHGLLIEADPAPAKSSVPMPRSSPATWRSRAGCRRRSHAASTRSCGRWTKPRRSPSRGCCSSFWPAATRQGHSTVSRAASPAWILRARDLLHTDLARRPDPGEPRRGGRGPPGHPGARVPPELRLQRGRIRATASDRARRPPAGRLGGRRSPRSRSQPASPTRATSPTSSGGKPGCRLRRTGGRCGRLTPRFRPAASARAAARTGGRPAARRAWARP